MVTVGWGWSSPSASLRMLDCTHVLFLQETLCGGRELLRQRSGVAGGEIGLGGVAPLVVGSGTSLHRPHRLQESGVSEASQVGDLL